MGGRGLTAAPVAGRLEGPVSHSALGARTAGLPAKLSLLQHGYQDSFGNLISLFKATFLTINHIPLVIKAGFCRTTL